MTRMSFEPIPWLVLNSVVLTDLNLVLNAAASFTCSRMQSV